VQYRVAPSLNHGPQSSPDRRQIELVIIAERVAGARALDAP
jgi:hypothetical protein